MARSSIGVWRQRAYIKTSRLHKALLAYIDAKKRMHIINGGYKGNKKEFEAVKQFWKPYGINPKKMWYQLYGTRCGYFEPRFIPDTIWESEIIPYYNNMMWGSAYADKCAYDLLFPEVKRPRTIAKNSCGRYYDGKMNVISREEVFHLCMQEQELIFKKATFSTRGESIKVLKNEQISESNVTELLDYYDKNFIIQELLHQHPYMEKLNPTSLNTIRVISFFFKDEVHILSAQLRIGAEGADIDNYSAGGFACNINEDGSLSEYAVSKAQGWVTEHPRGFAFKNIRIPNYQAVIEQVKYMHKRIPHLNIIGWDFAIGVSGDPVFIELNVYPGQNQNGSGPTFGNLTEEVLEDVFIKKTNIDAFS